MAAKKTDDADADTTADTDTAAETQVEQTDTAPLVDGAEVTPTGPYRRRRVTPPAAPSDADSE